jgi:hypothetical protein
MVPVSLAIVQDKVSELEPARPSSHPAAKLEDGLSPAETFESRVYEFP